MTARSYFLIRSCKIPVIRGLKINNFWSRKSLEFQSFESVGALIISVMSFLTPSGIFPKFDFQVLTLSWQDLCLKLSGFTNIEAHQTLLIDTRW